MYARITVTEFDMLKTNIHVDIETDITSRNLDVFTMRNLQRHADMKVPINVLYKIDEDALPHRGFFRTIYIMRYENPEHLAKVKKSAHGCVDRGEFQIAVSRIKYGVDLLANDVRGELFDE